MAESQDLGNALSADWDVWTGDVNFDRAQLVQRAHAAMPNSADLVAEYISVFCHCPGRAGWGQLRRWWHLHMLIPH